MGSSCSTCTNNTEPQKIQRMQRKPSIPEKTFFTLTPDNFIVHSSDSILLKRIDSNKYNKHCKI